MRRLFLALAFCLADCATAFSQTTINLSVTDTPDNQTWNNGTWSVQLIPGAGSSDQTRNFTLLSGGGSLALQSGSLSTTGTASFSLPANVNIGPSGTRWQFTVCSQAATACSTANITVTTSSPQSVTISPPSIRVAALPNLPPIVVYTTTEIASATIGSQITVVGTTPLTPALQSCTVVSGSACTTWAAVGGGASNSPNPAIPGPPVFNVKNYGAKGDAQQSANGTATSSTAFTCSDCNFSVAQDTGKNIACSAGGSTFVHNNTTIQSVTNSTTIVLSQAGLANTGCVVTWGTPDDTAVATAKTAFLAAMLSASQGGNLGIMSSAPVLYFPAGGYYLTSQIRVISGSSHSGGKIQGDGKDLSKLYFTTDTTSTNGIIEISSNQSNFYINDLTMDGMQGSFTAGFTVALLIGSSNTFLNNIIVQNFGNLGGIQTQAPSTIGYNVVTVGNSLSGSTGGFRCVQCSGEMRAGGSSNNGNAPNVVLQQVVGGNVGLGFKWYGGLIDECGTFTTGCTQVINSSDVWFIGSSLYGTPTGHCLSVDANSFVHYTGGICGTFGSDNNGGGPIIAAGGILQASDMRSFGSGTGKSITNNGTFNDNGGNSSEVLYTIASGTSTGTAAVLTVNTLGANVSTNCTAGDSLLVESASIAGYNGYYKAGITAVGTNTISYTTIGSNLGALGAGGSAYCRNLQTFTGNLPTALLNNPIPNTCYYTITPIANATTVTLCNFKLGSATNIVSIKASSQATTTCATAPLITISDGTVSQTLTLTTGKNSWDSSVDTSTGVGTTIFKPNGTITVKYDVAANSACATPATNLAVSYTISPILSN